MADSNSDHNLPATFNFEGHAVRIIMRGADPWWVLADVCRVLEIGNPSDVAVRLEADEQEKITLDPIEGNRGRGNPNVTIINMPGLNRVIFRSDKPEAKRFQRWVFHDVLPSIMKTGSYSMKPPQTHLETARQLVSALETVERQAERLNITEPSHRALHEMSAKPGTIAPVKVAKFLDRKVRKEIYPKMVDFGWIYNVDGEWLPNEKAKNIYVVRQKKIIRGFPRLTIRLTFKGAARLFYEYGREDFSDFLKILQSEEAA